MQVEQFVCNPHKTLGMPTTEDAERSVRAAIERLRRKYRDEPVS